MVELNRQCTAKSKRSGERCRRAAIRGGSVCMMHGGKSPQVLATARQRLALLVDPALAVFEERLKDDMEPALQLTAARDLLDRTGYSAKQKVELTGADGGAVRFDLSGLTDEELANLQGIFKRISGGG